MNQDRKQDKYKVLPLETSVTAKVQVPGSKSITNRALLLAALADGDSLLEGALVSEDTQHFLKCLTVLGFAVETDDGGRQIRVGGRGGIIPEPACTVYAGSAGTAARFLTAMLGFSAGEYIIEASEQMKRRPMAPLFDALRSAGAQIVFPEEEGFLPAYIHGIADGDGERKQAAVCADPIRMELDISESTQFLSALLMAAPMLPVSLEIRITGEKKDGAYVRITRDLMRRFGVTAERTDDGWRVDGASRYRSCGRFAIEPDMSAACYFYAAAAVTGSEVTVSGVHPDLSQGDLAFLQVLCDMGCRMRDTPEGICLQGPDQLTGIRVDMNNFSDQALTLAAIAPYAAAPVEISGIAHIRRQECDRIHAICRNLTAAGIRCEETEDGVRIHPGTPRGCEIETYEDHRVAMAFALLGLRTEGIWIRDPGCCAKTFPAYFQVLEGFKG